MPVRASEEKDYGQLASLYAHFFKVHNLFQRGRAFIADYLKAEAGKNELFVFEEGGLVRGALFLVKSGENSSGSHQRWKFRHFAFESESVAEKLLAEAERNVKAACKTAKIELTIAETEEGIDFYKKHGYVQEGSLKNHYRWGETCFVLGKSFC